MDTIMKSMPGMASMAKSSMMMPKVYSVGTMGAASLPKSILKPRTTATSSAEGRLKVDAGKTKKKKAILKKSVSGLKKLKSFVK